MEVNKKNETSVILSECLLGKIQSNVRMITLDCNMNFTCLKMTCYTDNQPAEKIVELMEDAVALYMSYGNNYEIDFDLSVEFSDKPFGKLEVQQDIMHARYILYARYEKQ
jgi:hypothetical protein